jgi:hypothetical protein
MQMLLSSLLVMFEGMHLQIVGGSRKPSLLKC